MSLYYQIWFTAQTVVDKQWREWDVGTKWQWAIRTALASFATEKNP